MGARKEFDHDKDYVRPRKNADPRLKKAASKGGCKLIKEYAEAGLQYKEIAEKLGVSDVTFWQWRKAYPQIANAVKVGNEPSNERLRSAIMQRATGYDVEESKTVENIAIVTNADGSTEEVVISKVVTTIKKHIPAEPRMLQLMIHNRLSDEFKPINEIKAVVDVNQRMDVEMTREAAEQYVRGLIASADRIEQKDEGSESG